MAAPTRTARRRRSSRSTRATAACSRWSAAATSARASSTSRCRASASRARRSSRSCSRLRCKQGISPATTFASQAGRRSPSATSSGTCTTTRARTSGTIDLETATTYSDNAVYAQLTQLVGPANDRRGMATQLGITSPLNAYFAIGLGAEAVNPLEMARAYSSFANGGQRDRRLDLRQPAARGPVGRNEPGRQSTQPPVAAGGADREHARDRHLAPAGASSGGHRQARASSPTGGPSPARPARPRTTATPGSSATRRSSSRRSGSAIRTS